MGSSNPDGNLLEYPVPLEAEAPVLTKTQKYPERLLELVRLGVFRFFVCLFGAFWVLCLLIVCIFKCLWLPGAFTERHWCHLCQSCVTGGQRGCECSGRGEGNY